MITDPHKLLAMYDRGMFSNGSLEIGLVIAAVGTAPEEFVSLIPADVLASIRAAAARPRETQWLIGRMVSYFPNRSPEQIQAAEEVKQQELQMFNEGLERWRRYFEGLGK